MKNSFWGIVGIPLQIKTIKEDSLSEALEIVYQDDDYLFRNSRWFVDIKNCFRIFNFNGSAYISKKTSEEKADQEIVNSTHAFEKLNGRKIGARFLRIVIPQKIKSISSNNQCYIVSEYVGTDLNEFVYSGSISPLSLAECLSTIKLLLETGIAYRGFLPRNTVADNEAIYLFDWEDARFDIEQDREMFDHLWRTNFLLNWSYLFGFNELDYGLKNYIGIRNPLYEPSLVKYESTFKALTNNTGSTPQLREAIDRIVFGAELPLTKKTKDFYIRPNDMGHLVADIFPSEIDVLHDILSFLFRQNSEKKFAYHIQLMTHLLALYFKATFLRNQNLNYPIQFYALIPIIMMLDEYATVDEYSSFLLTNDLETLASEIYRKSGKGSVVNLYLSDGQTDLSHRLITSIQDKISQACSTKVEGNNERLSAILNFVNGYKQ